MSIDDAGPSSLASAPSYAGPWTELQPRLDPSLIHHVTSTLGFSQMTPVQSNVIPLFLSHRDVIVEAVTGSGKTLAYALPVLQMIMRRNRKEESRLRKNQVGALVICPTRELAIQVHKVFDDFVKAQSIEEGQVAVEEGYQPRTSDALLVVGGPSSSPADDFKRFKEQGSDIIVGTPGRIEELLKRSAVDVKELEVLLMDEADRLLDLGFSASITTILQTLPKQRRTGLFSATMTDALGELARVGLRNPVRVVVQVESKVGRGAHQHNADKRTPASLQNFFLVCRAENKLIQLVRLLRREAFSSGQAIPMRKAIVYFSTCAQVSYFYKVLDKLDSFAGIKLYSLHGQQTPSRRTATFDAFVAATPMGSPKKSLEAASVLFCTDVAARGLDLPNVDLVVQFDPPTDPKVFSHRCGRTARAGRHGRAVVFLFKGREEDYVDFLHIRKSPVKPYPYLVSELEAGIEPEEIEDVGAAGLTEDVRFALRRDRELFDLSIKAFVSFIKCYKKHEANFIFREKDLNFGQMAKSFGLLRLPRMPEIDRWRNEHREDADRFDPLDDDLIEKIPYADKAREKQRQESMTKRKYNQDTDGNDLTSSIAAKRKMRGTKASESAWSDQKARRERRVERKEKKAKKRDYERRQTSEMQKQQQATHQEEHDTDVEDDWAGDEREAKKARKGKALDHVLAGSTFDDL